MIPSGAAESCAAVKSYKKVKMSETAVQETQETPNSVPTSSETQSTPPKRKRRWLRGLLLTLVVLACALAAGGALGSLALAFPRRILLAEDQAMVRGALSALLVAVFDILKGALAVWLGRALGLDDRGRIAPGLRADLAVWNAAHPAELSYRIGYNPLHARIFGGDLA